MLVDPSVTVSELHHLRPLMSGADVNPMPGWSCAFIGSVRDNHPVPGLAAVSGSELINWSEALHPATMPVIFR